VDVEGETGGEQLLLWVDLGKLRLFSCSSSASRAKHLPTTFCVTWHWSRGGGGGGCCCCCGGGCGC